jgi:hypothetical protein
MTIILEMNGRQSLSPEGSDAYGKSYSFPVAKLRRGVPYVSALVLHQHFPKHFSVR